VVALVRVLVAASVIATAGVLAFTAGLAEAPAQVALSADVAPAQKPPAQQPPAPQAQPGTPWSAPAVLNPCPTGPTPQVVFPSDKPNRATGAGAIVWSDSARCPGGEGARVAALSAGDEPLAPSTPHTAAGRAIAPQGVLVAARAPHGEVLIGGSSPGAPALGLLIQGPAGGPFAALAPPGGSTTPMQLASGYLGDAALASPPARGAPSQPGGRASTGPNGLDVHVERFFAHEFVRNVAGRAAGTAPIQALTLAMDFRSEVLAVWVQGTTLYTRLVPNKGAARAIQKLASVGAHTQISAVLSDDERAIVAWSEQRGTETEVYIDRSAPGVRFGSASSTGACTKCSAPQLLERFRDPDGALPPAASPSLVRLSSESVMLAWAGANAGRWVVRAAPVDLNGLGDTSTIAAAGTDALLAHFTTGPVGDAMLLWTEPLPTAAGPPDMARQAIFAARGFDNPQASSRFGAPEQLAPPASVSDPTVAIDPDSDRAVAVWRGEADAIEYAVRAATATP
jgi:hypothetical protein